MGFSTHLRGWVSEPIPDPVSAQDDGGRDPQCGLAEV